MIVLLAITANGKDTEGKYVMYGYGKLSCATYLKDLKEEEMFKARALSYSNKPQARFPSSSNTPPGFNIPEPQPTGNPVRDASLTKA